jgi:hypothetical protein
MVACMLMVGKCGKEQEGMTLWNLLAHGKEGK